jgi:hypothetical protein
VNTRTRTRAASSQLGVSLSTTLSSVHFEISALFLICVTLAVGTFLGFPVYDDGWMALVLRELGPHALAQHMGDRPVYGFLLERIASFGAANKIIFVVVNAILWLVFAIESGKLFQTVFPEFKKYASVVACLTLAPIVVQTQLCTALVTVPANLATILGYAAVLVLLRDSQEDKGTRPSVLVVATLLAALGVAISEYGVAAALVGCVILVGMAFASRNRLVQRRLVCRAAWLLSLTGAAYVLFAKTADFSVRPDVAPAQVLRRQAAKWIEIPFNVIAGAWHALIGAYATAFGNVALAWDSKSTLIGVAFGCIMAVLLCLGTQSTPVESLTEGRMDRFPTRLAFLIIAILIGLLPFRVMGRATTLLEFGSRFRIPIMPIAAAATVGFAIYLVRELYRWLPVAMFGFIVGYTSWIFTYTSIERTRAIVALQAGLKPYVAQTEGYTVAVVPFKRFETELTANIAATWPTELEKRLWVVPDDSALLHFGSRRACHLDSALDIHVRGLTRTGKLEQLVWVEAPSDRTVLIEPYCITSK